MNRRVLARINVMVMTIIFIGGFSAFNPACSQQTHAIGIDHNGAVKDISPDRPIER